MAGQRGLGIDPGTGSFDVCGVEGGEVFYEEVLDSEALAKEPGLLVEAVEEATPLDCVAGPSGYGVELTRLENLDEEKLREWYLTYILLIREEDLQEALERKEPGVMVYAAMTESALEMKRRGLPVCYLPGVVNMSTVPKHRKLNNMDMGTVDKLCSALVGIHDQSRRLEVPYGETSFVLVEMGAGYNAALGVEGGKIVDGVGGTMGGPGFLSPGGIDMETVQIAGEWSKSDVFTGGAAALTGEEDPAVLVENREKYDVAWNAVMEGVERSVAELARTVDAEEVLISGRLSNFEQVEEELESRVKDVAPVRKVGWLKGAEEVKEAAQGYGLAAEGLSGGYFEKLVEHVGIRDAEGTALDHLHHPTGAAASAALKEKVEFKH